MQDILLDAIFVLYYVQKNNNEGCVHVQKKCDTLLEDQLRTLLRAKK